MKTRCEFKNFFDDVFYEISVNNLLKICKSLDHLLLSHFSFAIQDLKISLNCVAFHLFRLHAAFREPYVNNCMMNEASPFNFNDNSLEMFAQNFKET